MRALPCRGALLSGAAETGYLAPEGFLEPLLEELGAPTAVHGRLVLMPGPVRPAAWAQNIWYEPQRIQIASIGDGVRKLRRVQRNWALYDFQLHRRAALIQTQLPKLSGKPLTFGEAPPTAPLGSWTLLDPHTILNSPRCSSPFPHGEVRFLEDRTGPPSRAYLKLWEAFTLIGRRPSAGEICLDLGASPGGWTWALQKLGAQVISVDKALLDPAVAALPGVAQLRYSAFALDPAAIGPVDWLFSDVVCYPARLLRLVRRWLEAGRAQNFLCTIKFQGATDHQTVRAYAEVPGSRLLHLSVNKHELTWALLHSARGQRSSSGGSRSALSNS
jgi:23S rRNA (cytidine2498-2'-O)-methyltransferase